MATTIQPIPVNAPIADTKDGSLWPDWVRWFQDLTSAVTASPAVFSASVDRTGLSASIGTTVIPLPALAAGNYQVSTYARITTVDAVSSSLTVSIGWTESTLSLFLSGAAMTGNTTSTVQTNSYMLAVDGSTPISYSTTYVSNTPNAMRYRLKIQVQSL